MQRGRLRGIVTDRRASPSGGFRVEIPHAQGREAEKLIQVWHSSQVDVVAGRRTAHGTWQALTIMNDGSSCTVGQACMGSASR